MPTRRRAVFIFWVQKLLLFSCSFFINNRWNIHFKCDEVKVDNSSTTLRLADGMGIFGACVCKFCAR